MVFNLSQGQIRFVGVIAGGLCLRKTVRMWVSDMLKIKSFAVNKFMENEYADLWL